MTNTIKPRQRINESRPAALPDTGTPNKPTKGKDDIREKSRKNDLPPVNGTDENVLRDVQWRAV